MNYPTPHCRTPPSPPKSSPSILVLLFGEAGLSGFTGCGSLMVAVHRLGPRPGDTDLVVKRPLSKVWGRWQRHGNSAGIDGGACNVKMQCLGFVLTALLGAVPVRAEVTKIDTAGLEQLIANGVRVIDIRRADEWQRTGVIEGAYLMTFFDVKGNYDFKSWLERLASVAGTDQPVVLICHSGGRSAAVSRVLHSKMGYTKVFDAVAGMAGWVGSGHSTVSPRNVSPRH